MEALREDKWATANCSAVLATSLAEGTVVPWSGHLEVIIRNRVAERKLEHEGGGDGDKPGRLGLQDGLWLFTKVKG